MHKIIYLITFLFISYSLLAEEIIDSEKQETVKSETIEENIQNPENLLNKKPNVYGYFKLGSSFLIQNIGVGSRYHNFETYKGHDLSFNMHVILCGMGKRNDIFLPSLKYDFLKYKLDNSQYFGIGGEIGLVAKYKGGVESFYPNIELIWGKERKQLRFTQFSINLLPAAASVVGLIFTTFGSGNERNAGFVVSVLGALTAIEYTIAF